MPVLADIILWILLVARLLLAGRVFVSNFSCQAFSCTRNTLRNFMHQREVEQADII